MSTARVWRALTPWDAAALVGLAVFWLIYVGPIVSQRLHGVDIFRDIGTVINMQHGRFVADPVYPGHTLWYPPLSPALVAGISPVFGVAPLDVYVWSQLFFNWMIPAGLFVVVRLGWGPRAAVVAVAALVLAMPWWQTEVAHGQPPIHAVVSGWAGLLLYLWYVAEPSRGRLAACAAFLGASFWHHPFVPAVLCAVILLRAVWERWRVGGGGGAAGGGHGPESEFAIVATALVIAAPVLYPILHGPVRNPLPRNYIADELHTVEFALMHASPWLWGMGIVGVVAAARARRRGEIGAQLLVGVLIVTAVAQVPGYVRIIGGERLAWVPTFVPHEFQRLFQIGWAVCIGLGVDAVVRGVARRSPAASDGQRLAALLTVVAVLVTGVPGLISARENLRRFLQHEPLLPRFERATAWIENHTALDDVFACEPDMAFHWLHWTTGRKLWVFSEGHSNPRVDWHRRDAVMTEMEEADTVEAFWRIAREHDIDYFVPSANWNPEAVTERDGEGEQLLPYVARVFGDLSGVAIYRVLDGP